MEIFLREIITKSGDVAKEMGTVKLNPSHLYEKINFHRKLLIIRKKVIESEKKFEFLEKLIEDVPSLIDNSKVLKKSKSDKK